MNTVTPLWEAPAVPVEGSDARFFVRRIYCVGRNHAEHAREMGGNPEREPPLRLRLRRRPRHDAARVQAGLKAKDRSWEMGKAFDQSAPTSPIVSAARIGHPNRGAIGLRVNSQPRQHGDLADMIWPVADIVANLSGYVTLLPGDLIFAGTPAGVGPVQRGDVLEGEIEGVGVLTVAIV